MTSRWERQLFFRYKNKASGKANTRTEWHFSVLLLHKGTEFYGAHNSFRPMRYVSMTPGPDERSSHPPRARSFSRAAVTRRNYDLLRSSTIYDARLYPPLRRDLGNVFCVCIIIIFFSRLHCSISLRTYIFFCLISASFIFATIPRWLTVNSSSHFSPP